MGRERGKKILPKKGPAGGSVHADLFPKWARWSFWEDPYSQKGRAKFVLGSCPSLISRLANSDPMAVYWNWHFDKNETPNPICCCHVMLGRLTQHHHHHQHHPSCHVKQSSSTISSSIRPWAWDPLFGGRWVPAGARANVRGQRWTGGPACGASVGQLTWQNPQVLRI